MYSRKKLVMIKSHYISGSTSVADAIKVGTTNVYTKFVTNYSVTGILPASMTTTTVDFGTTTADAHPLATDDYYNGCIIKIKEQTTNKVYMRCIANYVGSTGVATFDYAIPTIGANNYDVTVFAPTFLITDAVFKPNDNVYERNYLKSSFTHTSPIVIPQTATVTFTTELKGFSLSSPEVFDNTDTTGTNGYAPELHSGLRGCLLSYIQNVVSSSNQIIYQTSSDDPVALSSTSDKDSNNRWKPAPVTIYVFVDGMLHIITEAVGNITNLDCTAGQIPTVSMEFRGIYNDPVVQAMPSSVDYFSASPPKCVGGVLSLGGSTSYIAQQITTNLGNVIVDRPDLQASSAVLGVRITDRDPRVTMNPEGVATTTLWDNWKGGTGMILIYTVGATPTTTVQNQFKLNVSSMVIDTMPYGDRNGIVTHEITGRCTGTADGEWQIIGETA